MDALDVARWQFGVTTVYHFLFVPLTIGLGPLVAVFQTLWHRTGDERYLRLTRFYGKLFLINFAMGVVTGIVQEFQFGMNWSDYSRFVGDVFGAPLAIEALLAFFLESTFLGLWIFGWTVPVGGALNSTPRMPSSTTSAQHRATPSPQAEPDSRPLIRPVFTGRSPWRSATIWVATANS